jgi:polygalacturonase
MKSGIYLTVLLGILAAGCQSDPVAGPGEVTVRPTIASPQVPSRTFTLTDFGAVGDGTTDNTAAFAKAIAACEAAGGGELVVPAGTWLTGPIHFISNFNFHLDDGAVVLFSRKFDDYPLEVESYEGQQTVMCTSPISGDGLHDVEITGKGTIDGQGEAWRMVKKSKVTAAEWDALVKSGGVVDPKTQSWYPTRSWQTGQKKLAALRTSGKPPKVEDYLPYRDMLRPPLVVLANCQRVLLEDATFRNSPSWNIHLLYTDDIQVRGVTIFNPYYAQNGDGIDIDSCRNVSLMNCDVSAGDDVVCLKSGRNAEGRKAARPTENVVVAHCKLGKGHGGIAIGSEMSGGVKNVEVYDCEMHGTDEGLRFKTVRGRGGVVEDINIHDIKMDNITNNCITVDMYYMVKKPTTRPTTRRGGRFSTAPAVDPDAPKPEEPVAKPLVVTQEAAQPLDDSTPAFRNIVIRNIDCAGANIAMQLRGLPELPLKNVTIENAHIVSKQGGAIVDADGIVLRNVHIKSASVPSFQMQNATNLTIDNFDVIPQVMKRIPKPAPEPIPAPDTASSSAGQ